MAETTKVQTVAAGVPRGTQGFVGTLSWCWRHPSVTALEVLWRWAFGVAAMWFVGRRVWSILMDATGGVYDWSRLGLNNITVVDPVGAAKKLAVAISVLLPPLVHLAKWMGVPWLLGWIVISAVGRTAVLRRADPALRSRPGTLMVLQLIRLVALVGSFLVWFSLLTEVGQRTVTAPMMAGEEPNLLGYFAVAIVLTLGMFTLWAIASWGLSIAPLMAMLYDVGPMASLRRGFRLGPMRTQLVEVNLVLGIVKIALLVLLMVFSATPLPFETITTTAFLAWWTAAVAVVYFVASDFFHVARLVNYLHLWRRYDGERKGDRG